MPALAWRVEAQEPLPQQRIKIRILAQPLAGEVAAVGQKGRQCGSRWVMEQRTWRIPKPQDIKISKYF